MQEKSTIGTCGVCGGPVTQYNYLLIVGPFPAPKCERCGAKPKAAFGPVVEMEPVRGEDEAKNAVGMHVRRAAIVVSAFIALNASSGCSAMTDDIEGSNSADSGSVEVVEDDLDIVNDIDPQENPTYYMPNVAETNDKCCPTGNYYNCTNDSNDACASGWTLTACFGCDGSDDAACSPRDFDEDPWVWGGVNIGYFCSGVAFRKGTNGGQLIHDTCSLDGCFVNYGDGGVCTTSLWGNSTPHGCDSIDTGALSLFNFEGTITRMCCQQEAGTTNYECTPRSGDDSCSGLAGSPSGHTTSAYCMPCQVLSSWHDPDGTGSSNTMGAWDLRGTGSNEWANSVECSQFTEPALPNWTEDLCLMTEFVCRGTLVRSDGVVLNNECA